MRKKGFNFKSFMYGIVVFMLVSWLAPTITATASNTAVDLIGDSVEASSSTITDGVGYRQTGYLCYLLTADGNAVSGTRAHAFKCPSFYMIENGGAPHFRATSRKGGYVAYEWSGTAPWGCSPFNADRSTNAEGIRSWIKGRYSEAKTNGQYLILELWGEECESKFVTGDYILVIETVMHFRYSFNFTYKNLTMNEWGNLIFQRYPTASNDVIEISARMYKEQADLGIRYRAPFGAPIIGTVRDCIAYKEVVHQLAQASSPFLDIDSTSLFSLYLNQVACFAERIGEGSAGERAGFRAWTGSLMGKMTDAQVNDYGVAMLVISALDDDIEIDDTPEGYDGTIFTLTSTGGSSTSDGQMYASGGVGTTTWFGNGYSENRCTVGILEAENCAVGDEPYALARRLKTGMSFEGDVPPVVFSGTSYSVFVDNSMGIVAGMLTVDPDTFPNVTITASPESDYTAFLGSVKGSLKPSVSILYKNEEVGSYRGDSLGISQPIGGAMSSVTKELTRTCTLTQSNCTADGGDISWGVSGDYDILANLFAIAYYNNANAGADSGKALLENTDIMRAFWESSDGYVNNLKTAGTLKEYWDTRLAEKKNAEGASAGNWAVQQWLLNEDNAEPVEPTEPEIPEGTSNRERQDMLEEFEGAHAEWEEAHTAWEEAKQAVYDAGFTSGSNSVNPAEFTCTYVTENKWKFILHYCSPIMQRMYDLHDKIPLNDGPSRDTKLWDDAWKVSFRLNVANTASFGNNVMSRLLVYMPIAGAYNTTVGGSADVSYYVRNAHVSNTDFLLPDATSMDMR